MTATVALMPLSPDQKKDSNYNLIDYYEFLCKQPQVGIGLTFYLFTGHLGSYE